MHFTYGAKSSAIRDLCPNKSTKVKDFGSWAQSYVNEQFSWYLYHLSVKASCGISAGKQINIILKIFTYVNVCTLSLILNMTFIHVYMHILCHNEPS